MEKDRKPAEQPDQSRTDEARQVVQEYIDDQKALIKKLRKEQ